MNGISSQIENRIDSFHYQYYYTENQYLDSYDSTKFNSGVVQISYIDINNSNKLLNYFGLSSLKKYTSDKIDKYLIKSNKFYNISDVLIGNELANELKVDLGDSIQLYFPSDMNISTRNVPSVIKTIGGIFDIGLLEYNKDTIIGSLNHYKNSSSNLNYYFDNLEDQDLNYKRNSIISNMVIIGLNLEKKIYYFFGFLVIMMSCFMLFQINMQFIKEKVYQFSLISILGLKKNIISLILLIYNLFLMSLMSILGILLTNLTIFSNIKYDLFEFIYSALPFRLSYVSFVNSETLLLIFIVNIITTISTVIPIYIIGKSKYVKF